MGPSFFFFSFALALSQNRPTVTERPPTTSASNPIKQLHKWEHIDHSSQSCYSVLMGLWGGFSERIPPRSFHFFFFTTYTLTHCIHIVRAVPPRLAFQLLVPVSVSPSLCLSSSPHTYCTEASGAQTMPSSRSNLLSFLIVTRERTHTYRHTPKKTYCTSSICPQGEVAFAVQCVCVCVCLLWEGEEKVRGLISYQIERMAR